jgi:hypothetical protein
MYVRYMRMPIHLPRLLKRSRGKRTPDDDSFDRLERERLSAEYTGSFARNPGPHFGITTKPPSR